jgi:plastocyanin
VNLALCLVALAAADEGTIEGTVKFEVKGLLGAKTVEKAQAVAFLEKLDSVTPKQTDAALMRQKNKAFEPRLLVVQQGSKVDFPNDDIIFHNVFSLSKGNEFDLGVYREGTSKTVRFQNPGVVDVFCNIHPEMIASILVVQNDRWAYVGEDGKYTLKAPPGKHTVVVYWANGVLERKEVSVVAGEKALLDFTLVDQGRAKHLNKHGQQYGRYK